MKLNLIPLLLIAMTACGATTKTAFFTYDFTGGVLCSPTVQVNCYDHFEVGILSGGLFQSLGTIPIPANATGSMAISGDFQVPGFGSMTFAVIMVTKDQAGARATSDPLLATYVASVKPGPPTGLVVK